MEEEEEDHKAHEEKEEEEEVVSKGEAGRRSQHTIRGERNNARRAQECRAMVWMLLQGWGMVMMQGKRAQRDCLRR